MKWVTWKNVGIDRIGCAWLILREIDPQAEFLFIERDDELPDGAEAFDVPNVRFSHYAGHCSFYAFLDHYELKDPILHRIARIIDEADTIQQVQLEPTAAGLDLICEGLRLISKDDREAIERGRAVYDALYARLQHNAGSIPPDTTISDK